MSGDSYSNNVQRYYLWAPNIKEYVRAIHPTTKHPAAFTPVENEAGVFVYGQVYDNPTLARMVKQGALEVIARGQKQQQRSIYE